MGIFKRKKKGGGEPDSSGPGFTDLETGQEETDDLLSRLEQGVESSQAERARQEEIQAQKERDRVRERQEARARRRGGCGCGGDDW